MKQLTLYDIDPHIAEIYDQIENDDADIEQIRNLIESKIPLRILEPFCGTGRIAIPLASDGHHVVGLDLSIAMLTRAREKINFNSVIGSHIQLIEKDITEGKWPEGFDLVILGRNCLYELPTPNIQEKVFGFAFHSLNPGGFVYVDNNHMEGKLDESWQDMKEIKRVLSGQCVDGTKFEGTMQTIWSSPANRLVKLKRQFRISSTAGESITREFIQQKHPVSAD